MLKDGKLFEKLNILLHVHILDALYMLEIYQLLPKAAGKSYECQ